MKEFQVGEKVVCVSSDGFDGLVVGEQYTVDGIYNSQSISVKEVKDFVHYTKRFDKLVSIEKPILEERKKDKVRMELVDQGFPLALLELAKVMTWANENKGYKDHDWRNIPNAENAFKGAAARHRVKFDAQRSFGSEMLDCTDEESGIIHLAHEAFNVLALLELALVGKVK